MARPKKAGDKNRLELEEFSEIYAGFVDLFGDPVEVVFRIMALPPDEISPELRLKAAETLMSYKFPRLKALEAAPGPALAVNIHLDGVPIGERPQITIDAESMLQLDDGDGLPK